MDAPAIQYARSADGTNIACWSIGEGAPVLFLANTCHAELAWDVAPFREFLEGLSSFGQMIYLDQRGTGLSDPQPEDRSLDAAVQDAPATCWNSASSIPRRSPARLSKTLARSPACS